MMGTRERKSNRVAKLDEKSQIKYMPQHALLKLILIVFYGEGDFWMD